jgi:Asp-tRNA(Asn)/Glu-tRNA(Gln) amidotransferase C subunit
MTESGPGEQAITPELIRRLSALSGIELSAERAETLVAQAEQQLGLMHTLGAIEATAEPAAELRLDRTGGVR